LYKGWINNLRLKTFSMGVCMCVARFLAAASVALTVSSAMAATATDTFDVTLIIQDACVVTADNNMSFGTQGFLDTSHDATADITIQCTSGTIGTIALNGGSGASGDPTLRTMELGAAEVEYGLFTDGSYTTYWGDGSLGSSTVSHTGTGAATTLTIYGRTTVQGEPAAGTYSDMITVTVTY
jgi:spore coat protein U-like protein